MPTSDPLKRSIPTPSDPSDPAQWMRLYSLTNPGVVEVSSATEADAVLNDYNADCTTYGVNPRPLYVWRADIANFMRNANTGGSWEYLAGRQHGATVEFSRDGTAAGADTPPPSLFADTFVRASQGWTMSDDASLVIPATGLYAFGVQIQFSGTAGDLGRVFYDLVTDNSGIGLDRRSSSNEDNFGGTHIMSLSAGNLLKIRAYHEGGGDRDVDATMTIGMMNAPLW